jgi:tetratricopeptide (TPR) repeat protein
MVIASVISLVAALGRRLHQRDGAAAAKAGDVAHNLPRRNRAFIGREGLLADMGGLLDSNAVRLPRVVVLHGCDGVGKTEVALELAHRRLERSTLVWWIAAEGSAQILASLTRLGDVLGCGTEIDQVGVVAAIQHELSRRRGWLLIFDDLEDPNDVWRYLPKWGDGEVLITSRNLAWSKRIRTVRVPPFTLEESSALLTARTATKDDGTIRQLAAALDQRALTLDIAVGYLRQTGVPASSFRISYQQVRSRLLAERSHPEPENAVAAVYRLSVEELERSAPRAVDLLRVLAFLGAAVPLELLPTGADQRFLINALAAYRLVSVEAEGIRMHPLIQQITRRELARLPTSPWPEQAAQLVLAALPDAPTQPQHHEQFLQLLPHILALQRYAATAAPVPVNGLLSAVAVHIGNHGGTRRELASAVELLSAGRKLVEDTLGSGHPEAELISIPLAAASSKRGNLVEARRLLEVALPILRTVSGPQNHRVTAAENNLALILHRQKLLQLARCQLQFTLWELEASDQADPAQLAAMQANLGNLQAELGELTAAEHLVKRALETEEAIYGRHSIEAARTQVILARILDRQGRLGEAEQRLRNALGTFENHYGRGHAEFAATSLALGTVLIRLRRFRDGWHHLWLGTGPTISARTEDLPSLAS